VALSFKLLSTSAEGREGKGFGQNGSLGKTKDGKGYRLAATESKPGDRGEKTARRKTAVTG